MIGKEKLNLVKIFGKNLIYIKWRGSVWDGGGEGVVSYCLLY